ncbi:HAD-IA family hydrolase [Pokkaliibacter sp. MBI-7]|uniref:HAD-IA family hydrolase n=1 Tax=Pokkaliibacter sp. MBI-7 TaxID=3040600 RepID=UPI00244B03B9|nr:HAD-IA family hydrolase [Pokkaliibacter sp. MBI-7]MDH2435771.1 HAD-IA family hydrolase [Pokkaliibacter sp. MBI-7]
MLADAIAKPSALLFDLDGTLLDTAPDFHVVVNRLLAEEGRAERDYAFVRAQVSNGSQALVCSAFDITPDAADFSRLRARLLDLYLQHVSVYTCLFDGLEDVLDLARAASIPWGIVTNKPRLYSEALLARQPDLQDCAVLVCPDDVSRRKPHPEPLYKACEALAIDPATAIYVGDHLRDIESGKAAGMFTIGVEYGYLEETSPATSWGADLVVATGTELARWCRDQPWT